LLNPADGSCTAVNEEILQTVLAQQTQEQADDPQVEANEVDDNFDELDETALVQEGTSAATVSG